MLAHVLADILCTMQSADSNRYFQVFYLFVDLLWILSLRLLKIVKCLWLAQDHDIFKIIEIIMNRDVC